MDTKHCTGCKTTKPLDDFGLDSRYSDPERRRPLCKRCTARRQLHRQQMKAALERADEPNPLNLLCRGWAYPVNRTADLRPHKGVACG